MTHYWPPVFSLHNSNDQHHTQASLTQCLRAYHVKIGLTMSAWVGRHLQYTIHQLISTVCNQMLVIFPVNKHPTKLTIYLLAYKQQRQINGETKKLHVNSYMDCSAVGPRTTHRYPKFRGSFSGSWYAKLTTAGICSSKRLVNLYT